MAIPHAQPGQVIDALPIGARLRDAKTHALFKSRDLEVIRLVLPAARSLPPHRVPGEITIQCVEGSMSVTAEGVEHTLGSGQLLFLRSDVVHAVVAREDSSAIVTIALAK